MTEVNNKTCKCHATDEKTTCNYIRGISCDVKSCVYHDSETHCTANSIVVGPTFAASSNDTVCATFKPKEN